MTKSEARNSNLECMINVCIRAIEYLFYFLFFFVPLIFLPVNSELFEFNKMLLTYAITVLIGGFWITRMILQKRVLIQKTPLDIPILLFLASQIIATVVSIDVHTSIWGYYSRSNGGLASIFSYIFLYYAFVSNFPKEKTKRLLFVALLSGILVAVYGVLERLGIDKDFWVQDVQNRVFSTLGQPNWLAAYLSVLIPISLAIGIEINNKGKAISKKQELIPHLLSLITVLFYTTLLFTKSRSGFLGFIGALYFFIASIGWLSAKNPRMRLGIIFLSFFSYGSLILSEYGSFIFKSSNIEQFFIITFGLSLVLLIVILISLARRNRASLLHQHKGWFALFFISVIIISSIVGTPVERFNQFTLEGISKTAKVEESAKPQGPALEVGGTESGAIRKIVWKGAIEIAKHYPLFGSGVETFAYSYYKFRPVEHNRTSEWDFLYNKAHNEYLNYLANTGFVGLGTYLSIIGWFLFITLKYLSSNIYHLKNHKSYLLVLALLSGYISILVSNFFGFSVVVVNLFFFLIPAFVFVLNGQHNEQKLSTSHQQKTTYYQWAGIFFLSLISYLLLLYIVRMWDADRSFALGQSYNKAGEYALAYSKLYDALQKRPSEPEFADELSTTAAALSIAAVEQNESTLSAQLIDKAVTLSDATIQQSPNNPNYWRSRVRVFYTLAQIDPQYNQEAINAAKRAVELSPTDPKIAYNYGLILGQTGKLDEAIAELERTVALKPDYLDPSYALGLFYHEKATNEKGAIVNKDYFDKAILIMENILKISSESAEAKARLKEWRGF